MSNGPFRRRVPGIVPLIAFAVFLCAGGPGRAETLPQPPCGNVPYPPYPDIEASPDVGNWDRAKSSRDWTPPSCTGWTEAGFTTLTATAARFRNSTGPEGLLRRLGAISKLKGMRYWSTTHKRWRTLIVDAYALAGPDDDRAREDFSPGEMTEGETLYFHQEDNLTGKAVYRMRILSASPDRLVIATENISAVRYLLMPVFPPGGVQAVTFLDRESEDVWRYYGIMRTGRNASRLTAGYTASAVNRAVAYYRYLADIPTDKEPPAAP